VSVRRTEGQYILPVFTGREHGCPTRVSLWTAAFTGRVDRRRSALLVSMGRIDGPCSRVVRTYHPCPRAAMLARHVDIWMLGGHRGYSQSTRLSLRVSKLTPVFTGRVSFWTPVNTGHGDGARSRVVRTEHPCQRAAIDRPN